MLEIGNGQMASEFEVEPYIGVKDKWKETRDIQKNIFKVLWYKSEKNIKKLLHLGPTYIIKERGYDKNSFIKCGVKLKDLVNNHWNESDFREVGFTWEDFMDMNIQLRHLQDPELFSMYYLLHDLKINKDNIQEVFGIIPDLEENLNMNIDMLIKLGYTKEEVERNRDLLNIRKTDGNRAHKQKRNAIISKTLLKSSYNNVREYEEKYCNNNQYDDKFYYHTLNNSRHTYL